MNRREFSAMMGLGAVAMGAATQAVASAKPLKGGAGQRVARKDRKAWAKEHFKGFENVLMPSFTPDLKKLDEKGIRLDVRKSIEHGFFSTLCACIGLTDEETRRFLTIAVDEAKGRISVAFAQGGAEGTNATVNMGLVKDAERIGCTHMILSLPRTGTAEDLIKVGTEVSEATNMGIYLWAAQIHDFKRFHKSRIPFAVFDALADLPNVVALKVGDPDPATMFQLFERYNDRMLIGALMMNIMPFGIKAYGQQWSGAWTVEALQTPEKRHATDFFNLMMAGDYDKGMELYWKYVEPGFNAMMKVMGPLMPIGGHPWEHLKLYQFLGGGNGGRMRKDPHQPNLPPVTEQDLKFVQNVFRSLELNPVDMPLEAFMVGRKNYEKGVRMKDLKDLA